MATSAVIEATSPSHLDSEIRSAPPGSLVVVDFMADWCGPCKMLGPVLDSFSLRNPHVRFLKVNVDKVAGMNVRSLPTLRFMRDGVVLEEVVGMNVPKIHSLIEQHGQPVSQKFAGSGRSLTEGGPAQTQTAPNPLLAELLAMGFEERKILAALRATGGKDVDLATNYIIEHMDDEEEEEKGKGKGKGAEPPAMMDLTEDDEVNEQKSATSNSELTPEEFKRQQELVEEKLRKMREQREQEEVDRQVNDKKKEIALAKKMQEERERNRDKKLQLEIEKQKAEKQEAKRRKLELQMRMEWDRKERLSNAKPAGTYVGEALSVRKVEEGSGSVYKSPVGTCQLQVRLPSGEKMQQEFKSEDTIKTVHDYIKRNRSDRMTGPFVLMTTFPRKTFDGEALKTTLQDAGLTPRGVLVVSQLQQR